MDLWSIVKTVGAGVISTVVPGGGAIINAVNEFLPSDKKLPATATGDQIRGVLAGLPPEQQSAIMNKQFDVDITQIQESGSTLRTMLEADANNPHSTRPYIAKHSFHLLAVISSAIVVGWLYAVVLEKDKLVDSIVAGWPFVAAIVAPFVALLRSYFGMLKTESKNRLDAAGGRSEKNEKNGVISSILKAMN